MDNSTETFVRVETLHDFNLTGSIEYTVPVFFRATEPVAEYERGGTVAGHNCSALATWHACLAIRRRTP